MFSIRGGMRRAWLRGRENIHKRYLIHVAGFNLGVLDAHAPRPGHGERGCGGRITFFFALRTETALVLGLIAVVDSQFAAPENGTSSLIAESVGIGGASVYRILNHAGLE
jgi:hypothetical protein